MHKHKGPQWKTFWRQAFPGPQTWEAFGDSYSQIFFVSPQILLCSEKFVLNV